jgi:hypothetical protein
MERWKWIEDRKDGESDEGGNTRSRCRYFGCGSRVGRSVNKMCCLMELLSEAQ